MSDGGRGKKEAGRGGDVPKRGETMEEDGEVERATEVDVVAGVGSGNMGVGGAGRTADEVLEREVESSYRRL